MLVDFILWMVAFYLGLSFVITIFGTIFIIKTLYNFHKKGMDK
jgi:hypothetical protein